MGIEENILILSVKSSKIKLNELSIQNPEKKIVDNNNYFQCPCT